MKFLAQPLFCYCNNSIDYLIITFVVALADLTT